MKVFKSKVSYGLWVFIFGVLIIPLVFIISFDDSQKGILTMCAIMLPVIAFVAHLFVNTNYTIQDDGILKVKSSSIINIKVDINQIKSIKKTKTIISSPALSFDRMEISYGKFDSIIISPENEMFFVQELLKVNPTIDVADFD